MGLALLAMGTCGGQHRTPHQPVSPRDAGSASTDAGDAAEALPPNPPEVTALPPVDLAGVVLWLDGNANLTTSGDEIVRWRSRSPGALSFEVEVPFMHPERPLLGKLGRHDAVRFRGHERLVSRAPSPDSWTFLNVGDADFLLAAVVNLRAETKGPAVAFGLTAALSTRPPFDIGDFGSSDLLVVVNQGVDVRLQGNVGSRAWSLGPHALADSRPRLLLFASVGDGVQIRVNGKVAVDDGTGRLMAPRPGQAPEKITLVQRPLYIGSWDFDSPGIVGEVGEVVMVVGTSTAAAIAPLEGYLLAKYGL
ncbi:MAG TPA: hypothetical protein VGG33_08485 [Polyangia bacterium]